MTVPSTKFREDYAGNGSATSFPYAFRIFKATDLEVTKADSSGNETTLTLGTDYTVTGAGSYNGGAVVLTSALPTSYRLTIERVLAIRQDTDLRNQGEFLAETHEDAFDRLTMIAQHIYGTARRAIKLPVSDDDDGTLPDGDRSNTVIGFDAIGKLKLLALQAGTTLIDLAAAAGSSLIGFIQSGAGAVKRLVQDKLRERPSVFDFMTSYQIADVTSRGLSVDVTAACQAALNAHKSIEFPDGSYRISDKLNIPHDNTNIMLGGSVYIQQFAENKPIFEAIQKNNVWIHVNGGVLFGHGAWSASWTGNGGHFDQAIRFVGCTRSGAIYPVIKNCAHAGIAIIGGDGVKIVVPHIEGTHNYSTELPHSANFQNGIYITNDITYGPADDVIIVSPDISGVAQGILRESQAGAPLVERTTQIVNPNVHDIPGQHAFYIQSGKVAISNPTMTSIALSGVKIQSGDAGEHIDGFTCTGANAKGLGSSLFEIATIGGGSLSDLVLSGTADGCGYGLSINTKVKDIEATINVKNVTGNALYIQGDNCHDIDVDLYANGVSQDGIIITATNSSGLRIRPVIRNPNTDNIPGGCGINVASNSANVELFDPDVTDANTKMQYGLFNSIAGSDIKVRGSARFAGASDVAIRATGSISEFPTEAILSGTNGAWYLGNIRSSQPMVFTARSNSASNVVLWVQNLVDESAYLIQFELVGKLLDASERRVIVGTACVYRDGGGAATMQGSPSISVDIASAGFAGVYGITVNGAEGAVIVVNSGGIATYDWKARISVTPLY